MREFAELRAYAGDAVFQPDFGVIRGRARRLRLRRRLHAAGAATLLFVGAFITYAENRTQRDVPPAVTAAEVSDVVATGTSDLFGIHRQCNFCTAQLYASTDTGVTWQPRTTPPMPPELNGLPRVPTLIALGRDALLWRDGTGYPDSPVGPTEQPAVDPTVLPRLWLSGDGGRTWRRPVVSTSPAPAVADGFSAFECTLLGYWRPCPIYAVDPSSGIISPLAGQPAGITIAAGWSFRTTAPAGDGLWVPGLDPVTRKPAVASSTDGGRTWHTTVFTAGVPAPRGKYLADKYLPMVAAGAGGLAYAVIYRAEGQVTSYRTTDSGRTWTPLPPLGEIYDAGWVTGDGAHVVHTRGAVQASRQGGAYTPVTLPGYPAVRVQLPAPGAATVPGRYLTSTIDHDWISDDGWTWRVLG
jgi:hypothetical protein